MSNSFSRVFLAPADRYTIGKLLTGLLCVHNLCICLLAVSALLGMGSGFPHLLGASPGYAAFVSGIAALFWGTLFQFIERRRRYQRSRAN